MYTCDSPEWYNLFRAVVSGIALNNNVDFVLQGNLDEGRIISQLPHQYKERFEVVRTRGSTFIISKPRVPTGEVVSYIISQCSPQLY